MKEKISELIYETLDYMYCDNCRYSSEKTDKSKYNPCEDCYRKMNGWAVAKGTCDRLAEKILKK